MTVAELIAILEKLPPEASTCKVCFDDSDQEFVEVTQVGKLNDGRVLLD